ncbi:MAG TPA: hypothetical protein VKP59_05070 [Candidatus Thermoplasmatota archaeon]|nr:hypothetical protein [Candidatus Thermoplasmatota archaeon]
MSIRPIGGIIIVSLNCSSYTRNPMNRGEYGAEAEMMFEIDRLNEVVNKKNDEIANDTQLIYQWNN